MYPRLLLVPHSGKKYSQRAIDAAAQSIPEHAYQSIFVVSTWHNMQEEHSFEWMLEALQNTHLGQLPTSVIYMKTNEFPQEVVDVLTNQLDSLILFNSDLTHYGVNYQATQYGDANVVRQQLKKRWELPFLNGLSRGEFIDKSMPYKPCGVYVLEVLARIVRCFNYEGTILDYYDSMDIEKTNDQNFVSYVAMGFTVKRWQSNFVSNFILRFPKLTSRTNPVFLSFMESPNISVACVGIVNDDIISNKLRKLEYSTLEDYKSQRLSRNNGREFYGAVTVLNSFIEIPLHDVKNIQAQNNGKWVGVQALFQSKSAIFIPDVWRLNPSWTIDDMLNALSLKANAPLKTLSKVEIFTEVGTFT